MSRHSNIENDSLFETQLDAIRNISLQHTPDVVDSVMQHISSMPLAFAPTHNVQRRRLSWAGSVAAACIGAVVATTLFIRLHDNSLHAAPTAITDLDHRFIDVYNYCNNYADDESIEAPAYYDNPVSELF